MIDLPIPSFLTAAMKLSLPINGVFVPFKQSVTNLQRFCRPVMFHNQDPVFDLSCSGSSFLFRHRAHNLLLCTRHQLVNQGRDPQDVALIVDEMDGRKVALSPNGATRIIYHQPAQANLSDIFLAEYASERNGRNIDSQFLRFDLDAVQDLRTVAADKIVLIFAIGYPTRFSSFETKLDQDDGSATGLDVISRWTKLYLEPTVPSAFDHELRLPLQIHRDFQADIGDPDGFSGSPVFFVYQDDTRQAHLGFAGMITHANKLGRFLVYETANIRTAVDRGAGAATTP